MNTKWKALIVGGAVLAGLSGTAAARDHVNFSLSFGVPAYTYAPPAPAYYGYAAAAPAYYDYAPPVVYYSPPPARVYYAPAWGYRYDHGRHRGWDRHHQR
jgi:hypothetical protein